MTPALSVAAASLKTPSPKWAVLLLWLVVGMINLMLSTIGPPQRGETTKVLASSLAGTLISLALFVVAEELLASRSHRRWFMLGGAVLVAGSTLWAFDVIVQAQRAPLISLRLPQERELLEGRFNWVYCNLLFSLQMIVMAFLESSQALVMRERQLASERLALQQARLDVLRSQLSPHFLFNALNAISTLAGEQGANEAEEAIERLSDFLRVSLSASLKGITTLDAELETVQAYLGIEAVRFGERLVVAYDCETALSDGLVPSLLLQPLVENSLKFAVARSTGTVTIRISAVSEQEQLILRVEDEGRPYETPNRDAGTGLGLRNVADRLEVLYGTGAKVRTEQREQGFLTEIRLPLEFRDLTQGEIE